MTVQIRKACCVFFLARGLNAAGGDDCKIRNISSAALAAPLFGNDRDETLHFISDAHVCGRL